MEQIITAIISGLCVAIPSVIATISSNKKNNDLIQYKINELTKKVEKHNQVVERVYKLEQANAVKEESIKVVNHKIENLEKKVGEYV